MIKELRTGPICMINLINIIRLIKIGGGKEVTMCSR